MIIEYPFYMAYKKTTCILCSLQAKKKEEILVTEKASSKEP